MLDPAVAGKVRLLALDVDGVLTDNAIYIAPVAGERVEFKRFDIQDGLGIGLMRLAGIPVVFLSGRYSEATVLRANELKVDECIQDCKAQKLPALKAVLERRKLRWEEVAFAGDDLADIPVLRRVGLPIAVANAVEEVKNLASYVTNAPGGAGAVREVIEVILKAKGLWAQSVRAYLQEREDDAARLHSTG